MAPSKIKVLFIGEKISVSSLIVSCATIPPRIEQMLWIFALLYLSLSASYENIHFLGLVVVERELGVGAQEFLQQLVDFGFVDGELGEILG